MLEHTHVASNVAFGALTLTWFGMMAAMMAPTAWPWVQAYHRFDRSEPLTRTGATAQFASGYLLAWLGYAIAAAILHRTLDAAALMQAAGDATIPTPGAVIFLVAGLYQFAPLKRACLMHCRTPLGYFLTRWVNGPVGALRMGLHHGIFCVGCCWALMATAFAVGIMNVWWMAALAAVAFAEQMVWTGEWLRRALGAAFVVAGAVRLMASV